MRFRKAVIATGGRARVPPISGVLAVLGCVCRWLHSFDLVKEKEHHITSHIYIYLLKLYIKAKRPKR